MSIVANKLIRLFVVEDYRLIRIGLECDLEQSEQIHLLGSAENAEEAIERITQQTLEGCPPDVVLMDIGLPGINGIDATEQIKLIHPDIKVIMLTSHDQEDEISAALAHGVNGYCLKDISSERLVEVIDSVADGATWFDPEVAPVVHKAFKKSRRSLKNNGNMTEPAVFKQLTDREQAVLKLLSQGRSNAYIADELMVSVHTVKSHVSKILEKLNVDDRLQAVLKAIHRGYVDV